MPPEGEIMIQSPFQHQSPHSNSPRSGGHPGSSGSHPRASPTGSSTSQSGGYGRSNSNGKGNSPNQNSPPQHQPGMYGPPHGHYMGHGGMPAPMQSPPPPYSMPPHNSSGNGSNSGGNGSNNNNSNNSMNTPSHHPYTPHHHNAYPMHPMYHGHQYPPHPGAGPYPYHPHMAPHGAYPQHRGAATPYNSVVSSMGGSGGKPRVNTETPNGKNMMLGGGDHHPHHQQQLHHPHSDDDKTPMATAISRKNSKDTFGSPLHPANNNIDSNGNNSKPVADAALNVDHMKHDFYFFVQDMKEKVTTEATDYLHTCTPSPLENEDDDMQRIEYDRKDKDTIHPYLLFSNMNERLIAQWEKLPQPKRSEYLIKEEEDRRRFQSAEEVASQHCATLTARARSPQAFSSRNSSNNNNSTAKKVVKEEYTSHQDDARSPSPTTTTTSLNKILQSEGNDNSHTNEVTPSSQTQEPSQAPKSSRSSDDIDGDSPNESPTKKNKVDPLVRFQNIYSDTVFYHTDKHDSLSADELHGLANRVPKQAKIDTDVEDSEQQQQRDTELLEAERLKFVHAAQKQELFKQESGTTVEGSDDEDDDAIDDDDDNQEAMEVESLLDRRLRNVRGKKIREYLVRWKGLGQDSDSWEPLRNVEHCEEMIKVIDDKKKQEKENAKNNSITSTTSVVEKATTTPSSQS